MGPVPSRRFVLGAAIAAVGVIVGAACDPVPRDARMGDGLRVSPVAPARGALVVCASGVTLAGIDVSSYQGTIDWGKVAAAGVQYAFIRVSDGLSFPDAKFAENWVGARAHGLRRGAYQFFRSDEDPSAQAELLLRAMGPLSPGDLPPVIDVESTDAQTAATMTTNIGIWLDRVESVIQQAPIIYTGPNFWNTNVKTAAFAHHPLWVAHWGATCPSLPTAWSAWQLWQNSATGTVSGIGAGSVDLDVFNGDAAALSAASTPVSVCVDGICAGDETSTSCSQDCPSCREVPSLGRVVDDRDACFTPGGDLRWQRFVVGSGYDARYVWTRTWVTAQTLNYGLWLLPFAEAGSYRVEAFVEAGAGDWAAVPYLVRHRGVTDVVVVDQVDAAGWVLVGDFDFDAGAGQWVRLDDAVATAASAGYMLVFDALRLTRLDPPAPGTPPPPPPVTQPPPPPGDPGSGIPPVVVDSSSVAKPSDPVTPATPATVTDVPTDCAAGGCAAVEVAPKVERIARARGCAATGRAPSGAGFALVLVALVSLLRRRASLAKRQG